jgi:hypothetical protein
MFVKAREDGVITEIRSQRLYDEDVEISEMIELLDNGVYAFHLIGGVAVQRNQTDIDAERPAITDTPTQRERVDALEAAVMELATLQAEVMA